MDDFLSRNCYVLFDLRSTPKIAPVSPLLLLGVAFWYKPDSSHRNLYPSAKDENGNPIEATVDGEKIIQPCEHGIEVFKTGCVHAALCT